MNPIYKIITSHDRIACFVTAANLSQAYRLGQTYVVGKFQAAPFLPRGMTLVRPANPTGPVTLAEYIARKA